jgi:hypothetical protein
MLFFVYTFFAASISSVLLAIVVAARSRSREWSRAILYSMTAALPAMTFSVEGLYRHFYGPRGPEGSFFVMLKPMAIAFLLLLVPLAVSYVEVPLRAWPLRFEILRLLHIATWLMSLVVVLLSLIASVIAV